MLKKTTKYLLSVIFLFGRILTFSQCSVDAGQDQTTICGSPIQLAAYSQWREIKNNGLSWTNGIWFKDRNTGFVTGTNGGIKRTTNGGGSWVSQTSGTTNTLVSISFPSPDTGYIVGLGGSLIRTTDGGNNWTWLVPVYNVDFYSIFFADANTGYIACDQGVVLKTTDRGQNWVVQNTQTYSKLYSIHFLNTGIGYAAGENAVLLKTIDGGNNWVMRNSGIPANITLYSVFFTDPEVGYITSPDLGKVMKTIDGGENWYPLQGCDWGYYTSIYFSDAKTGYLGGFSTDRIYSTHDAGIHWSANPVPACQWLKPFVFPDSHMGYTVDGGGMVFRLPLDNTYSWAPSTGLDSANIFNPTAGPDTTVQYVVTMTTQSGCKSFDTVSVIVSPMPAPSICLAGVDSANNNIVIWNKPVSSAIDTFHIYRETPSTGNFQKIGSVSYNSENYFVDAESMPAVKSNRYKISLLDHCGFETSQSSAHKTIHLTIYQSQSNSWSLIWEPYQGFDVKAYYILRSDQPEGMKPIDSISGSSTQYTDFKAPAGYVYYQIAAIPPESLCTSSGSYTTSKSNIASNDPHFFIDDYRADELRLKISPNPVKDRFCVDLADFSKNTELFLFTADGHQLISQPVTGKKTWIDVSRLPSGLYYIRVIGQRSIGTAKILKSD